MGGGDRASRPRQMLLVGDRPIQVLPAPADLALHAGEQGDDRTQSFVSRHIEDGFHHRVPVPRHD